MKDCIFCKIASGVLPAHKVYEDEDILAFLDIHPINPGHTLVIPKEHYKDLAETPPELASKLIQVVQKIKPAVLGAVDADSFNLGVNVGEKAGQVVFHTHFHIMPRFEDDGHQLWGGKEMDQEELDKIADKIKNSI